MTKQNELKQASERDCSRFLLQSWVVQSHSLALPLWHLDMRSGHEKEQEWFNNLDNWLLCDRGLIVPVIVRLLSSRIETRRFQMRHNIDICSCQARQCVLLKNAIPIAASAFRLKGKLGKKKLLAQSLYRPQTKTSLERQFSPKSPEVGQKSGQRIKNSRNKNQTANSGQQLLQESTYSGQQLLQESTYSLSQG